MKRPEHLSATPSAQETARHLGTLARQARLARGWTLAELAERSRVSQARLKRIEKGALSASFGAWLAVFERLGLLRLFAAIEDPSSEALLNQTRARRARRKRADTDLDF